MAITYEKTLTVRGIEKNVERFADSLKNANYEIEGTKYDLDFLKVNRSMDSVSIYLYFDDGVEGTVSNIKIVDTDDEVIIEIPDSFTKEGHMGFYILFRYRFIEEEER